MRRGLTATVGTILGTALLIGAKYSATPSAAGLPDETVADGSSPAAGVSPGRPGPAAGPSAGTSAKPAASARPGTSAKPSGTPKTTAKPTQPAGGLKSGTFTGPGVSEKFGVIKVTITVSGGLISNVGATCSCSGRSETISSSAFATLEPRVLSAQSADVQSVSGANYTYTAYKQSLGAAIDSAKA